MVKLDAQWLRTKTKKSSLVPSHLSPRHQQVLQALPTKYISSAFARLTRSAPRVTAATFTFHLEYHNSLGCPDFTLLWVSFLYNRRRDLLANMSQVIPLTYVSPPVPPSATRIKSRLCPLAHRALSERVPAHPSPHLSRARSFALLGFPTLITFILSVNMLRTFLSNFPHNYPACELGKSASLMLRGHIQESQCACKPSCILL